MLREIKRLSEGLAPRPIGFAAASVESVRLDLDHNRKGPTPFDSDAAVRLVGDVADELPPSLPLSSQAFS